KKGARVRGKVSGSVGRKVSGKGQISREEVRRVIDEHRHEVQSCYDRALISNPSLRGKLTVEWTIGLDGRPTRIRQKFSTLRSPQVASCIMKKMRRWKFPRPRGGVVVVSNPFTFAPVSY
ncbi:MAG: AgmX/PglI C-terminal domain-containing protein, partial [Myxococcota bacterium]